jgi:UDP-N-acetylglucosamine 2-epimerase (hydrolysing)
MIIGGSELTGKRLLFATGTRADYGKIEPLAKAAQRAGARISFFVTGMHMMKRYGETRVEVKRFAEAEIYEFVNQREGDALDLILSKTVLGFSDFVHEHCPDLVVIHGDRVEALAASISSAMRSVRSAHVEGGEVSGSIDESFRHCNTKLCTTHFVSCELARARVLSLGESSDRVFNIGSPELDVHLKPSLVKLDDVKTYYEIPFDVYGVVSFHPVVSEKKEIGAQTQSLFANLEASGKNFVVIFPNNDPGSEAILAVLEKLPRNRFRVIPSMRFNYFSELLKNAALMVGNSSAGVREAPFLGIPSLDIGTRQKSRSIASSVKVCSAFDAKAIRDFLSHSWGQRYPVDTSFGRGNAADSFIEILNQSSFWEIPLQKEFMDQKLLGKCEQVG